MEKTTTKKTKLTYKYMEIEKKIKILKSSIEAIAITMLLSKYVKLTNLLDQLLDLKDLQSKEEKRELIGSCPLPNSVNDYMPYKDSRELSKKFSDTLTDIRGWKEQQLKKLN